MAKNCQIEAERLLLLLKISDMLENTQVKSDYDKISSKAVARRRCHQEIKRSRHQDKTRRTSACFACLLGWILLGWIGCYAWIGSEIQFRIVKETPQGVKK